MPWGTIIKFAIKILGFAFAGIIEKNEQTKKAELAFKKFIAEMAEAGLVSVKIKTQYEDRIARLKRRRDEMRKSKND